MANPPLCGDLLSDLPVDIIESILVYLPIRDAIRTSILSSKWRFKWTTLPHLVFYESDMQNKGYQWGFETPFKTFVTRTLLRHEGPLDKFMVVAKIDSCAETRQWLLLLSRKDIKELVLDVNQMFDALSSLYLLQNLTLLKLSGCVVSPPPPNFKGFPCLRTLILRSVPPPTIQNIFAHSPLLETSDCTQSIYSDSKSNSEMNLKYLKIGFDMPSCLYLFQSLTFLELCDCEFNPTPPNLKGFPCLRTLIIRNLAIPIREIQSMVEQSPLLESLELLFCLYLGSELMISAPNLKYLNLKFDNYHGENVYFYAPLLSKLTLSPCYIYDTSKSSEKATYCYYTKLLGGFANLDTLIVNGVLTKHLTRGIEHYQQPLVFHRLKTVILGKVGFKYMDEILFVVRLIVDASATLCHLQLSSCYYDEKEDIVSAHSLDSICPQNCTFGKLKSVRVEYYGGRIREMNLIKFLLASSPVLEMLKIIPDSLYTESWMLNSKVKLSSYPRASPNASILVERLSYC